MSIRSKLIRLASEHPEFRKDLLPLITSKRAALSVTKQDVIQKIQRGEFRNWDAGLDFPKEVAQKLSGPQMRLRYYRWTSPSLLRTILNGTRISRPKSG